MRLLVALALAAAAASADETLPVPAAARSLRMLFAVERSAAVPVACAAGGRLLPVARCLGGVPNGALVRFGDGSTAKVSGRGGTRCSTEGPDWPALRLGRAPRGARYATFPASWRPPPMVPTDAGWLAPRPSGHDQAGRVQIDRFYAKTHVLFAGDGGPSEIVDFRDDSRPIEVLAALDLDGDGAVELLLRTPGRKTSLHRRGPRGWSTVGEWGCRD